VRVCVCVCVCVCVGVIIALPRCWIKTPSYFRFLSLYMYGIPITSIGGYCAFSSARAIYKHSKVRINYCYYLMNNDCVVNTNASLFTMIMTIIISIYICYVRVPVCCVQSEGAYVSTDFCNYTHTHVHLYLHTYTHTHTHIHTYTLTHTYICIYIYTHAHTHTHTRAHSQQPIIINDNVSLTMTFNRNKVLRLAQQVHMPHITKQSSE